MYIYILTAIWILIRENGKELLYSKTGLKQTLNKQESFLNPTLNKLSVDSTDILIKTSACEKTDSCLNFTIELSPNILNVSKYDISNKNTCLFSTK